MFAEAYMGRKRILPMLSLHAQRLSPLAARPIARLGVTAASHAIALQERIVEIHYTHFALRLNINNNSAVWPSWRT
ncbi:MAG: hypothetical protein QOH35_4167 [Acidobacteriaceae bacterium]|nr:hypothetical protein [Acidobacteriaceae bacterium]